MSASEVQRLFRILDNQALRLQPRQCLGKRKQSLPLAAGRIAVACCSEQLIVQPDNAATAFPIRAAKLKHDDGEVLGGNGRQVLGPGKNR